MRFMKRQLIIIITMCFLVCFILLFSVSASINDAEVIGVLTDKSHFKYPMSLFVDNDGDKLIVADTGNNQIKILSTDGSFINSFGDNMSIHPTKVIKDSGSRYIICDPKNGSISFFDRRGEYLDNMSFSENPQCGVIEPVSLEYNSKEQMLVLDRATSQVKIYSSSGDFLFSIGREGTGEGELSNPSDLSVDRNDDIYIVDKNNNRISVFNSVGNFIRNFGQGKLNSPTSLDIHGDSVYVLDTGNSRIQVFSKKGELNHTIGRFGIGPNEFRYPNGLMIDSDGYIWVADTGNNRIVKLDKDEQLLSIGRKGASVSPRGITSIDGYLYVAESSSDFVNVYSTTTGEYVQSIGSQGTESTNLNHPTDCNITNRGDLVVADSGNNRIQIYSLSGDHLFGFGEYGSNAGQFNNPQGIGIDQNSGNILIADTGNSRVVSASIGGSWDFSIVDRLEKPVDVAVDSQSRIWVVDEDLGEVLIFDKDGRFEKSLYDEAFTNPSSITIDEYGRIFICDAGVSNVRVFSESEYELSSYGKFGGPLSSMDALLTGKDDISLLNQPSGLCISGMWVYISDTSNSRILKVPLSDFGGLPKLFVDTETISFEKVPLSTKRSRIIHIMNQGSGTIEGEIKSDTDWIETVPTEFEGEIQVEIWVDGKKAREGLREGNVTINCNGGIQVIPISCRFFDGNVKRIVMVFGHREVEANGRTIKVYPAPFKDENYYRVYVHFRFIGEELGAERVTYNPREGEISYFLEGKTLRMKLGTVNAELNGEPVKSYSPPYLFRGDRRYPVVPLRFVAESLGASVMLEGYDTIIVEYP